MTVFLLTGECHEDSEIKQEFHEQSTDKTKTTENGLNSFQLELTIERNFMCTYCKKSFTLKNNLTRHIKKFHSPSTGNLFTVM